MGYCDSKKLEARWFNWLISSDTPIFEPYRNQGILWTKVVGTVKTKSGKSLPDPSHQQRFHYITIGNGIYCQSYGGKVFQTFTKPSCGGRKNVLLPLDCSLDEQIRVVGLEPMDTEPIQKKGYFRENPTMESWHAMLEDVSNICHGISKKFTLPTEEHREELAQAAFLQVIKKLADKKLVYKPGLAPVFNLLTTTIYRCMYSELNKNTKQQKNLQKIIEGVATGSIRHNMRSLRCPAPQSARQKYHISY